MERSTGQEPDELNLGAGREREREKEEKWKVKGGAPERYSFPNLSDTLLSYI